MTSLTAPAPSAKGSALRDLARAERHLEHALDIVSRLCTDPGGDLPVSTSYPLGEAVRTIHNALVALGECELEGPA